MKGAALIAFALLIDGAQAFMAFAFFLFGAFPGTFAGGAAGCALGAAIADRVGCFIGGAAGALVATPADALAVYTIPIGVGLGIAVNLCIDVTLGLLLVALLRLCGMFYGRYAGFGAIMELVPGLNNAPGWTLMTVMSVVRKKAEQRKLEGGAQGAFTKILAPGTVFGATALGIVGINQATAQMARDKGASTQVQQNAASDRQGSAVSAELKNIDGIRHPRQSFNTTEATPIPHAA
ncbi:MAG: hypothetical protein NT019_01370 [Candidatus Adlerbacteria bacterium]|nr:hypothetical protein [Candidatus Adlerbacteria bacterium]